MAEIIDILMHQGNNSAYFTVNTGLLPGAQVVPLQPALLAEVGGHSLMQSADGNEVFQNGDNILILSMGFYLPLGFEIYESVGNDLFFSPFIQSRLEVNPSGAIITPLPPTMFMPLGNNYEVSLGNWVNVESVGANLGYEYWSKLPVVEPYILLISMVGVPDELDGIKFHVPVFVKISHTLPLVGAP